MSQLLTLDTFHIIPTVSIANLEWLTFDGFLRKFVLKLILKKGSVFHWKMLDVKGYS